MPKKSKPNNQAVPGKEIIERFDKIDERFVKVDERFDKIENKMATKDDIVRLSKEIIKNSEDIKNLKETVATKDDINRIMSAIDTFGSRDEDYGHKAEVNTHRLNEIEPKVEAHEKRIGILESTLPLKP